VESNESKLIHKPEELRVRDNYEKYYWRIMCGRILKDWRLYLMLLPLLLVFLLWRYLPLYELVAAFKTNDPTQRVLNRDFVGFTYFYSLMFGADASFFWLAFRNTFLLAFYGLLFGFPVPIVLALLFSEINSNGYRSLLQIATYLPRFVSTVVVTTIIHMLLSRPSPFSEPGVLAQFLGMIRVIPEEHVRQGIMYLPQYFRSVFQISGIWEAAGFGSIVYFAAIIGISPASYEAASIDGATKIDKIRHVVLPSILSTITIMLIMNVGQLLTVGFERVLLLMNNETYDTAEVVSTYVFSRAGIQAGGQGANQALASAADMINAVASMLLVIGANMISKRASNTSLY